MPKVETQIDINAPPSAVSAVASNPALDRGNMLIDDVQFFNFSRLQDWHSSFYGYIVPEGSDQSLAPGGKIDVDAGGFEFTATIKDASDTKLERQGPPVHGVIAGLHSFHIEPHPTREGSTVFRQNEEYSGLLSFVMTPWLGARPIKKSFEVFNRDLKIRVEEQKS